MSAITRRSLEDVQRAAVEATSALAFSNDIRELGSRQGPVFAAQAAAPRFGRFAATKCASRLLAGLICGAAGAMRDGCPIGRERARVNVGWALMTPAEIYAFVRQVPRTGVLRLHRCADLVRSTSWFQTHGEARASWRRRCRPLDEFTDVPVNEIVAVKWLQDGLAILPDPTQKYSINWGTG